MIWWWVVRTAFASFLFALFCTFAAAELHWAPSELLADTWWHGDRGAALTIDSNGAFVLKSVKGEEVLSGTIEPASWEQVGWHPGNLNDAIILRLRHNDRDWVIAGYYIWGEGDPPGLELLTRSLPEEFKSAFGIKFENRVLWLSGSGPH